MNNLIEQEVELEPCNAALSGDPMLGPNEDNGGPTKTFALLPGSPAINAGDNATCAAAIGDPTYGAGGVDQRGIVRPQGVRCDIGAYELEVVAAPVVDLSTTSHDFGDQLTGTTSAAQSITLTNSGGAVLNLGTLGISGEFGLANNSCNNATIMPTGICSFDVTFSPLSKGAKAGLVSIPSNAATTPDTVALVGNGTTLADLSVSISDSADPVLAGSQMSWTITVNNSGPSDASNVVVTDTLPAGVTLVSTAGCAEDPSAVPGCSLGTITTGNSKQFTVTADVAAATQGTITYPVSVTSDTTDNNDVNNSASESTLVNAQADLSISQADSIDPVVAGESMTYTITVNNAGPSKALDVMVTDTLPAGLTVTSTSGCTEDPTAAPSCTLGTIAVGSTAQYTVSVDVDASLLGDISNLVSVSSTTVDPEQDNNTASNSVQLVAVAIPVDNPLALFLMMLLMGASGWRVIRRNQILIAT